MAASSRVAESILVPLNSWQLLFAHEPKHLSLKIVSVHQKPSEISNNDREASTLLGRKY